MTELFRQVRPKQYSCTLTELMEVGCRPRLEVFFLLFDSE